MELKEALLESGIAEAWFDGYTAVVVKKSHGYELTIHGSTKSPRITHDGLSLEQVEKELRIIHPAYAVEWMPVALTG